MKHSYDIENILEQYELDNKNELFGYIRKNSKNNRINLRYANLSYLDLSGCDLSNSVLSGTTLYYANLSHANLSHANLSGTDFISANLANASLDLSAFPLSCKTLHAKLDKKHIIQLLYHAAMPTQKNKLEIDEDLKELLNSDLFKRVVNRFHRISNDCEKFEGVQQ